MQLHSTKTQNEDFMLKQEKQQTQDYGNEPFIYAANLNLDELIEWLKTELATLSHRKEWLSITLEEIGNLNKRLASLEKVNQILSGSLRLSQESNLLSSANQYQTQLRLMLSDLRNSVLSLEDFQGLDLSEEQKQATLKKQTQAQKAEHDNE